MKRGFILLLVFLLLFSLNGVSAAGCDLEATLINQDPYPAIPGEYVKIVFQLAGTENPLCARTSFELIEKFPFSLDEGTSSKIVILGGTFVPDFKSYLMIPYKIRVDKNALEGENQIEVRYLTESGQVAQTKLFNITVEDVRTDFEVSVKDFNSKTNTLTFEILNVGEHDAEAVTIEIPEQEHINLKGSNRNVVGSLDMNEDATFNFEVSPESGEIILKVFYTDEINVRRELTKQVLYDSSYFTGRKAEEQTRKPVSFYISIALALFIILIWIRSKWKKRKKRFEEKNKRY